LRIAVTAKGFRLGAEQRRIVEQRVIYALSRFGAGVERVAVGLADETNALGGLDRRCRMRAWLRNRSSVAVETLDGQASLDRAAERLVARVEWALVNGQAETVSPLSPLVVRSSAREGTGGERHKVRKAAAVRRRH
jgi:hypothetical protein